MMWWARARRPSHPPPRYRSSRHVHMAQESGNKHQSWHKHHLFLDDSATCHLRWACTFAGWGKRIRINCAHVERELLCLISPV